MWVPKLLLRIFCTKMTKFGSKLAFKARPYRLIWCPVCGLVGGCGAQAVSCKTPIYSMYFFFSDEVLVAEGIIVTSVS